MLVTTIPSCYNGIVIRPTGRKRRKGLTMELFKEIEKMLKDYFRKLERDDYDPRAVEKMKAVNRVLDELQKKM